MTTPNDPPYKYIHFKSHESYRRYIQEDIRRNPASEKTKDNEPLHAQSHGSYGALLLHPYWKAKRKAILNRDMNCCVHCKGNNDLQVHHRQYHFIASRQKFRLPWDYPDSLLITLCESCHSKGHAKYKVPTITI